MGTTACMGQLRGWPRRPGRSDTLVRQPATGGLTSHALLPTGTLFIPAGPRRTEVPGHGFRPGPGRCARKASGPQVTRPAATTETASACPESDGARPPSARTEEGRAHGCRHHASDAGRRCPLRTPDPALEPEDEAVHLHRAQRHLHHRPAADAAVRRPRLRVHQGDRRPRRHRAVRRHQAAGPGGDRRAGDPGLHAVRQPALAGRHADQLPAPCTSVCSGSRTSRRWRPPASSRAAPRRRCCC